MQGYKKQPTTLIKVFYEIALPINIRTQITIIQKQKLTD